jgi:hypothetical protein
MGERMKERKVTEQELNRIFSLAHTLYVNNSATRYIINDQAFRSLCYLQAAANVLDLNVTFKEALTYESDWE